MSVYDSDVDAAWAAGLFEGEGSISHFPRKDRASTVRAMRITMTDEDVVRRFHQLVEVGTLTDGPAFEEGHKHRWIWYVQRWADLEELLLRLLPYFGTRRRKKALELLANPSRPHARPGDTHCIRGHPYREHAYTNTQGTRLCGECDRMRQQRRALRRRVQSGVSTAEDRAALDALETELGTGLGREHRC